MIIRPNISKGPQGYPLYEQAEPMLPQQKDFTGQQPFPWPGGQGGGLGANPFAPTGNLMADQIRGLIKRRFENKGRPQQGFMGNHEDLVNRIAALKKRRMEMLEGQQGGNPWANAMHAGANGGGHAPVVGPAGVEDPYGEEAVQARTWGGRPYPFMAR